MKRFQTLDGLRGFAALFVMLWHIQQVIAPNLPIMPSSYLAVDLFFLISGFVIANGYTRKLDGGMTVFKFLRLRVVRLFPLYYLGCAAGLAYPMIDVLKDGELWHLKDAALAIPAALFLLPDVFHAGSFPLNPPGWSLFYEMVINILFAAGLFRLGVRRTLQTVFVLGVLLIPAAVYHDRIITFANVTMLLSTARTAFSFLLGVALYQLWRNDRLPFVRVPAFALIPIMMVCMMQSPSGVVSAALVMTAIGIAFPVILIAAVQNEPTGRLRTVFNRLGELSYPIYAIHYPVMLLGARLLKPLGLDPTLIGLALALGIVGLAWLALTYVDQPLRDALAPRVHVRRASVATEAPAF